jgi:glycerol-3-phosphate acyltransferase PlsX
MLKHLRAQLNPAQYNGASFLGLQKTVIKSHGGADENAFVQALAVAREQVLLRVPERIHHQFSH